jgi:predicted phage-related endonuclease
MTLTAKQIAAHADSIGASDLASILGVGFESPYDVWAKKTHKLISRPEPTEAMERGNAMEPALMLWARKKYGVLKRDVEIIVPDAGFPFVVHLDGQLKTGEVVEAKAPGLFSPMEFGEEGTGEVPVGVAAQVTGQMRAARVERAIVVADRPAQQKFAAYFVAYDKQLAEDIMAAAHAFWWNNVQKDIPPENSVASQQIIKRMRREPGKTIQVSASIITQWKELHDRAREAQKQADQLDAALKSAMKDAEAATSSAGSVTYFEQAKSQFELDRFRMDMPELAEKYTKTLHYRVTRFTDKPLLTGDTK